jgi:membrane protease YdiL (CAAX protease family)
MDERLAQPTMITATALAAYGGLVAIALLVGSWWGVNPWGELQWTQSALPANGMAILHGLMAAVPLVLLLVVFDRWTPWLLRALKQSVDQEVVPLLMYSTLGDFLLISVAAGFGEELFFRGLLQRGLLQELQQFDIEQAHWVSICLASLIFGVCHWINREYALAAGIVGIYLGAIFYYSGNLLAPITTHAVYDFIAMWYLVILKGRQREWPGIRAR